MKEPNHRHRGLLRARRERPRGCAAEKRDELAPFHWPMPPVLRTERIAHLGTEETAALRDFNPGYDCLGSFASLRRAARLRRCPLCLQWRPNLCVATNRRDVPCVDGSELARRIFTARRWSVQPCVRPVSAVHMTAGHNALRGSGPGQKPAFDNALAHVGCPDRRIDRLCITCCSPSQPSHHAG